MAIWGGYKVGLNDALSERTRQAWHNAPSPTAPHHRKLSTNAPSINSNRTKSRFAAAFWQRNPLTNQTNTRDAAPIAAAEPTVCQFTLERLPQLPAHRAPQQVPLASLPMDLGLSRGSKPQQRQQLSPVVYRAIQEWAGEQLAMKKATRQRDQGRALRQVRGDW